MTTKHEWISAKAELSAIEMEREALVASTKERYDAAHDKLLAIESALSNGMPLLGVCEGCSSPIFDGERHSYDRMNSIYLCEDCTPTWRDMLLEPETFYDGDDVYYTAETAKAAVDAHLAAGGSLDDKMVSA